jgi:hypothetical protein
MLNDTALQELDIKTIQHLLKLVNSKILGTTVVGHERDNLHKSPPAP